MSRMKCLLEEVQFLLECKYNAEQISQALDIPLEMVESAIEYWTDFAE